jgi:chromosome segregation ATPase
MKHFNEHRQQLSMRFDHDVVEAHDELLEQINQMKQLDNSSSDLFSTIDQWETSTIEIVKRTANRARDQLIQLLNNEKETLKKQFDSLTQEIRSRREEDEFAENDLRQLRAKINKLQQSFKQLARPNNINVIASQIGQVDWNRLICVEKQQEKGKYDYIIYPSSFHRDPDEIISDNNIRFNQCL